MKKRIVALLLSGVLAVEHWQVVDLIQKRNQLTVWIL